MQPLFNPALYKQRHQFVVDFIKINKTKKVVDLGCGHCALLKRLKFNREIEHLVGVDISGATVEREMHSLAPIPADYLQPGQEQLRVELYQGSVTERDARLRGFDLAISIELIEHLFAPDVERFSEVLFGFMAPVHAIVSTPNSDYNPLLPGLRGFRHPDHKFEWTRREFQSWAEAVCGQFGYEVDITGVGQAPEGQQEQFGFCSQIAVFHRLKQCNLVSEEMNEGETSYTLLYSVKYPSLRDNNVLHRVLVREVLSGAESVRSRGTETQDPGEGGGGLRSRRGHVSAARREASCSGRQSGSPDPGERCTPVALSLLWASCPRVRSLCGSLSGLRQFLTDEPQVRLSLDGAALLLEDDNDDEEDEDEEELFDEGREGSNDVELGQTQTLTSSLQENWEED